MASTIIWTIVIIACLGLVLAIVLYLIAEKFKVEEDPRIDEVEQVLPGANCGGCGYAGCRAFADSAVKAPNLESHFCPVGGNDVMGKVASILGYEVKAKAPLVAVLRCNGTCQARPKVNEYDGFQSCRVKATLYSGDTDCLYGCLGCGDCVASCQFGALSMDPVTGIPVVDEEKCTACGACVRACPKTLFELRSKGPRGMRMVVTCRNREKGAVAKKACSNACIGCSMCYRTCTHGAIIFENNLSYIDYNKCKLCRECEAVCPTGAIHGINFSRPLDKDAVKARIADRNKRAREKAAAEKKAAAEAAKAAAEAAKLENNISKIESDKNISDNPKVEQAQVKNENVKTSNNIAVKEEVKNETKPNRLVAVAPVPAEASTAGNTPAPAPIGAKIVGGTVAEDTAHASLLNLVKQAQSENGSKSESPNQNNK